MSRAWIAAPLLLVLATPCRGQDTPASGPSAAAGPSAAPLTVTLLLLPNKDAGTRAKLIDQLARLSAPQTVDLLGGVPLETFLRTTCGFSDDALVATVRRYNTAFGASVTPGPRQLLMPACPHWEFDKTVVARRDGLPGALEVMDRYMGFVGPITQAKLFDVNPALRRDLHTLRRGMRLVLPYAMEAISFKVREDLGDPKEALRAFVARFPDMIIRPPTGPLEIDLVRNVAPAETLSTDVSCQADPVVWPFDHRRVESVLRDFVAAEHASLRQITIVVADTGIARADIGRLVLVDNRDEAGDKEDNGRDDGQLGDGINDDRYGANMDPLGGFPARPDGYERATHGIGVAGLALGGMRDDALEREFVKPSLQLAIANVVRSNAARTEHYITEVALMNSLELAEAFEARVVNWSVESRGAMSQLEQRLPRAIRWS